MDITVVARNAEIHPNFRAYVEGEGFEDHPVYLRAQRVDVELTHERNPRQAAERIELTVYAGDRSSARRRSLPTVTVDIGCRQASRALAPPAIPRAITAAGTRDLAEAEILDVAPVVEDERSEPEAPKPSA